jgi:hypothetical protein
MVLLLTAHAGTRIQRPLIPTGSQFTMDHDASVFRFAFGLRS